MLAELGAFEGHLLGREGEHDVVAGRPTSLDEPVDEVEQGTREVVGSHPQILPGTVDRVRHMPRSPHPARTRSAGLALLAAASVALLSGCSPEAADPTETAAPTAAPGSPTAAPEPTETAEPPLPFEISCDALVTADQLYAFNPNFGADPAFEPTSSDVIAVVEEDAGTACGYLNQTQRRGHRDRRRHAHRGGGRDPQEQRRDVEQARADVRHAARRRGLLRQAGGSGEAQVFHGPYWIVIDSAALFEPGDAQQLVAAVLANLPAA